MKPRYDPRVFLALRFSRTALERLIAVQEELKPRLTNWHFIEPDNFHLTLRFFGDVSEERLAQIDAVCQEIAPRLPPFQFRINEVDYFGSPHAARVLFVSGKAAREYSTVMEAIHQRFPLPEDQRSEFRPHITLARARKNMEPRMEQRNAFVLAKLRDGKGPLAGGEPLDIVTVHREFYMLETIWVGRAIEYQTRARYTLGSGGGGEDFEH